MAYVEFPDHPRGVLARFSLWYSRRKYGETADPLRAAGCHRGVLMAWGVFELLAASRWHRLDPALKALALQRVNTQIGCPWCVDFGYWEGVEHGVDARKLGAVSDWRDATVYDDAEVAVLEFAEAATTTPSTVTEDCVARLRKFLEDDQIVELASWVALENYRSRFNSALGLTSQGFAQNCSVPTAIRGA